MTTQKTVVQHPPPAFSAIRLRFLIHRIHLTAALTIAPEKSEPYVLHIVDRKLLVLLLINKNFIRSCPIVTIIDLSDPRRSLDRLVENLLQ